MNEQGYSVEGLPEREIALDKEGELFIFPPKCENDPDTGLAGRPNALYALPGMQVEPEAGYWGESPRPLPRVVPIDQILHLINTDSRFHVRPYTDYQPFYNREIEELAYLESRRNNNIKSVADFTYPTGYYFGENPMNDPVKYKYLPISDFLQLHSPPFGAIFNIRDNFQYLVRNVNQQHQRRDLPNPGDPRTEIISTGRELARMFEIETPGLLHHHALNYIFYKRAEISPPRQARVWMALDVAIYSALVAAWYFKWAADPTKYSYRQRPYEYDRNRSFRVLYDDVVDDAGDLDKCARGCPCPSPGTPRHPAYPSGHSTYSSAASEILKYFFRDEDTQTQLDRLANNIGTARLWAGVHWRSDHIAGVQVGRAVAYLLAQQLRQDCIPPLDVETPCEPTIPPCNPSDATPPPTHGELRERARRRRNSGECERCQDVIPPQRRDEFDDCGESRGVF
jgi:membrane-associated phospholipid phosphatase